MIKVSKKMIIYILILFVSTSYAQGKNVNTCKKSFKAKQSQKKKINKNSNVINQNGKDFLIEQYKKHDIQTPERHFVLGSGISAALDALGTKLSRVWEERFSIPFASVPGLRAPTVHSHHGLYRYFVHRETGKSICFQCGRIHGYEDLSPQDTVRPVMEPFLAGTKKFVLTNISGSLRSDLIPGTIIALKDHVNHTGKSPLTGPNPTDHAGKELGLRFPHMEEVYNKETRNNIVNELKATGLTVEEGTYICVPGPNLETPAEVNLFAKWGLDVVGMSTVWEAIALKHAGAEIAGFSMISNPGSGLKGSEITDEEMLKSVKTNGEKMLQGFLCFCNRDFTKDKEDKKK